MYTNNPKRSTSSGVDLFDEKKELNEFIGELTRERDNLYRVINEKLWNEETHFYYDLWKNGKHNMVRHIGAFWALISGCAPRERAEKMIAYLSDEGEFKSPHRVPTLSKSHPDYAHHGGYWCCSIWAPTNCMVLKGLDRYGHFDLSHEIGKEHLDAVVDVFRRTNTLYENYSPELIIEGRQDKGYPAKADFVGWSGLVPISVLFEYVFGIKPNAETKNLTWHVSLLEEHGIDKYPFGTEGELTLMCRSRNSPDEMPCITVKSNIPVTLTVIWGSENNKQSCVIRVQPV